MPQLAALTTCPPPRRTGIRPTALGRRWGEKGAGSPDTRHGRGDHRDAASPPSPDFTLGNAIPLLVESDPPTRTNVTRRVHRFATGGRERLATSGTETLLSPAVGDARQHGSRHRSRAVLPPSARTAGHLQSGSARADEDADAPGAQSVSRPRTRCTGVLRGLPLVHDHERCHGRRRRGCWCGLLHGSPRKAPHASLLARRIRGALRCGRRASRTGGRVAGSCRRGLLRGHGRRLRGRDRKLPLARHGVRRCLMRAVYLGLKLKGHSADT